MKKNKNNKKQTAAQRAFSSYTTYISETVIDTYGPSYANQETMRNTWRNQIPYTDEIADFLVFKTHMYIRFLDARDSNSTNPQFLRALTHLMADYLSAYTMHSSAKITRKRAKEILKKLLYDNSAYIQTLLARQELERNARESRHKNAYKRPNSIQKKKQQQSAKRKFNEKQNQKQATVIEIVIRQR